MSVIFYGCNVIEDSSLPHYIYVGVQVTDTTLLRILSWTLVRGARIWTRPVDTSVVRVGPSFDRSARRRFHSWSLRSTLFFSRETSSVNTPLTPRPVVSGETTTLGPREGGQRPRPRWAGKTRSQGVRTGEVAGADRGRPPFSGRAASRGRRKVRGPDGTRRCGSGAGRAW